MNRKHLFLILLILLSFTEAISQIQHYKYTVSAGANREQLRGAYGNHVRMYYNFTPNFMLNAEFARYYEVEEKSDDEAIGWDFRSLDVNVNYAILFGERERFAVYGILGLTYLYGKRVTKNASDTIERFWEQVGMNAGFGLYHEFGRFRPYVETRTIASGSNYYMMYAAGLAYSFGKLEDD